MHNKIFAWPSWSRVFFLIVAAMLLVMIMAQLGEAQVHLAALHVHAADDLSDLTLYLLSLFGAAVGVVASQANSTAERFGNFVASFCIAFGLSPIAAAYLVESFTDISYDKTLMAVAVLLGAVAVPVVKWVYTVIPRILDKWLKTKNGE